MHYWSIYPIRHELIEGSECARMMIQGGSTGTPMPTPRVFDEKAYVFTDYIKDAAEPLIVELTYTEEGEPINSLPEIAAQIEVWLTDSDTRCVWISKGLASQLDRLLTPPKEII